MGRLRPLFFYCAGKRQAGYNQGQCERPSETTDSLVDSLKY